MNKKYDKQSYIDSTILFFSNNTDFDYFSEQSQLEMLEFADNVHRCRDCVKPWIVPDSIEIWHNEFREWLGERYCDQFEKDLDPFLKVIERQTFSYCLNVWTSSTSMGRAYKRDLKLFSDNSNLHGYRF